MDLFERTGVDTLMDGRLLRAAGLMSKSAMIAVAGREVYRWRSRCGLDNRRRQSTAVPVASGNSAQRDAEMHS
jgi:hypothetical protein